MSIRALLLLLLLYATIYSVRPLPITSSPLEANPDHLTWDALLMADSIHTSSSEKQENRRVKSIFITPILNDPKIICSPGYKLGVNNKCYVQPNIDPLEILKLQITSVLGSNNNNFNNGEDDYDYENFDNYNSNDDIENININFNNNNNNNNSNEKYYIPLKFNLGDDLSSSEELPTSTTTTAIPLLSSLSSSLTSISLSNYQNTDDNSNINKNNNNNNNNDDYNMNNNNNNNKDSKENYNENSYENFDDLSPIFHNNNYNENININNNDNDNKSNNNDNINKKEVSIIDLLKFPSSNNQINNNNNFIINSNKNLNNNTNNIITEYNNSNSESSGEPINYFDKIIMDITDTTEDLGTSTNGISSNLLMTSTTDVSTDETSTFETSTFETSTEMSTKPTTLKENLSTISNTFPTAVYPISDSRTSYDGSIFTNNTSPTIDSIDYEIQLSSESTTEQITSITNNSNENFINNQNNSNYDYETKFQSDLKSESLITDDIFETTTILSTTTDSQTITIDNDKETATLPPVTESIDNMLTTNQQSTTPQFTITTELIPTTERIVQTITPIDQSLYKYSSMLPSSSSSDDDELFNNSDPLMSTVESESEININNNQLLINHELNEDVMDNIDENNRFVYHHLIGDNILNVNRFTTIPTTTTPSTIFDQQLLQTTTPKSLIDQLRFLIKYSNTNNNIQNNNDFNKRIQLPSQQTNVNRPRIRFPERGEEPNIFDDLPSSRHTIVRFPGPVSALRRSQSPAFFDYHQRFRPSALPYNANRNNDNRDTISHYRLLPQNEQNSNYRMSYEHRPRENSKSPTEKLYNEVPVTDYLRTLEHRNFKFNSR